MVAMQKWQKLLGVGGGMAVMAGLAVAVAPAAGAATDPGTLTLCSNGGYASYVTFPDRGGFSTFVIPNGQCHTTPGLTGSANESVDVYDADTNQLIGATIYNGSQGETIVTIAGPSFYAYAG